MKHSITFYAILFSLLTVHNLCTAMHQTTHPNTVIELYKYDQPFSYSRVKRIAISPELIPLSIFKAHEIDADGNILEPSYIKINSEITLRYYRKHNSLESLLARNTIPLTTAQIQKIKQCAQEKNNSYIVTIKDPVIHASRSVDIFFTIKKNKTIIS